MKYFLVLIIVLLVGINLVIAQESKKDSSKTFVRLPELKVSALNGSKIVLPDSAFGLITLVALGFQRNSQDDLNTWLFPFAKEFRDSTKYTILKFR